jgi:hypothetical protein
MIQTGCNGEISVLHYRFDPWNIRYVSVERVRIMVASGTARLNDYDNDSSHS